MMRTDEFVFHTGVQQVNFEYWTAKGYRSDG